MNLKKLFFLFWTTLIIGGGTGLLLGFLLQSYLGGFAWLDSLMMGFTCSSVSMLGFFAYLIFQWLALGFVRSKKIYNWILVILLLFVTINLFFLNFNNFKDQGFGVQILIPMLLIGIGILVAWLKVRWTNKSAWVPTLFFMIAVTTFEAIPSLNPKGETTTLVTVIFTVLILLICNAWQILQLHRLVQPVQKKELQKQNITSKIQK